jgi:hypothetical protein
MDPRGRAVAQVKKEKLGVKDQMVLLALLVQLAPGGKEDEKVLLVQLE